MKLFIAKNKKNGNKKAFDVIKKQIIKKPVSLIGLAVGETTDGLYKLISKDASLNPKIWEKVRLFQIDENLGISPSSPLSFNYEIRKELKQLFKIINPKNIFLIDGTKNPKIIIKEAYKFIRKNNSIDLTILGLGPEYDPHIGYNTSGKSSISSRMRVVKLHPKIVEKTKRRGGEGASRGITLGIKDILDSKKVLLIAYGKHKAMSVRLALGRKVNMKIASASALLLHKNLTVVTDKEASCKIIV